MTGRNCLFYNLEKYDIGESIVEKAAVYILANGRNWTLYVGVTSYVARRVFEHKSREIDGFTKKYGVQNLVWFQFFENMSDTLGYEKKLKNWKRAWKTDLIEKENPYRNDPEI